MKRTIGSAVVALAIGIAWQLVLGGGAAAQVLPHKSFSKLVISNGYSSAIYDAEVRELSDFYDHLYRNRDKNTETVDLLYDAYFGVRIDGTFKWFPKMTTGTFQPVSLGYVEGTGIVQVTEMVGDLEFQRFFFSPLGYAGHAVAMVIRVTNKSSTTAHTLSLYSLHNFHVGTGAPFPLSKPESASWDAPSGILLESGDDSQHQMLYKPLEAPTHYETINIFNRFDGKDEALNDGLNGEFFDDNLVPGFQWDLGSLAPGATQYRGVLMVYTQKSNKNAEMSAVTSFVNGRASQALLDAESTAWAAFIAKAKLPSSVTSGSDRRTLALHSLVMLKMGQVNETNSGSYKPNGQIVASLVPGIWNISWVRDAAYAITALARVGLLDEAKRGLLFMLEAKTGVEYKSYVGEDYLVSVTRYFGDGTEESDTNVDGPNIEFDNIGLFLWALGSYLAESGDKTMFDAYWPAVRDKAADLLVKLVDPATGLIVADSSIWEHHWNGKQKPFAYTSITAVRGLCAASRLATLAGDDARALTYKQTAAALRLAIQSQLVDSSNVLAGNLTELKNGVGYYDTAVVEAFNFGLFDPQGTIGTATLGALDSHFRLTATGNGYYRNDDGDTYDNQEWIFVDLRMANAWWLAGDTTRAAELIDWVVAQSKENYWLIAEQYDKTTADYTGSTPMVGFGPGAFLLLLRQLAGDSEIDACWTEVTNPEPVADDPQTLDVVEPDTSVDEDLTPADLSPDLEVVDLGDLEAEDVPNPFDAFADATSDTSVADTTASDLSTPDIQPLEDGSGTTDYTILDDPTGGFKKVVVDDGCGCRLHDRSASPNALLASCLLLVAFGIRRRRSVR
ncbi:MAG: hypothetical protein KC609_15855 [Myxococcales bacterium]|nr:hypothetical protein [Myxococcales bacterium]